MNMMGKDSKLGKSIVISYISIIFTLLSGFLYTPWLIRELGTSDYAIYSIATSLVVYFTMDFGIGATITRFIARCRAEDNEEKIKGILGIALKIYLIIDAIAFIALFILFFFISGLYQGLTLAEVSRLKVVYIIIGMMTVFCIPLMPLNGVYIAYNRIYNVKIFDLLTKVITIILVCIALLSGHGLYVMVLINAAVTVGINYIKLVYLLRTENIKINITYKDKKVLKEILLFSGWLALAMVADKFFFSIEPSLLGAFSNSTQVAIFAVASQMEGYVLLLADGLNGIFLPKVTEMVVRKENTEKITDLMIKVGRLQLLIVTALIIGIITQGKQFIEIWFGKNYILSYYAVIIVLIPCFIHMTQGIASEMIYATNNVRYRAFSYCVGAVINVILTVVLSPKLGSIGAAIGISIGFFVGHELIMNIIYYKMLKLNIRRFFANCHLKMIIPATISLGLGYLIFKLKIGYGFEGLMLKCFIWLLCYVVCVYFLFMNGQEKNIVKNILRKIRIIK